MYEKTILAFFIILLVVIQITSADNLCRINRPGCYEFCGNLRNCYKGFYETNCSIEYGDRGCFIPAMSCKCYDNFRDISCYNTQPLHTCNVTCSNQDRICVGGCNNSTCSDCQPSKCSEKSNYCLCSSYDFSLSINPTSGRVVQGSSIGPISVNTIHEYGGAPSVEFFCGYLPNGATCSFSPVSCTSTCTSSLTITTVPTTPSGTYDIIVGGRGGEKTKYRIYTLTVASSGTPQMSMWINDPKDKTIVDSASLVYCTTQGNEKDCLYQYYTCSVTGYYSGRTQDVGSGTYSSWINLWYCESCGNERCDQEETCLNCRDCYCSINQVCCSDGICRDICGVYPPCNHNGMCEQGESCNCDDCYDKKDACKDDLVCNATTQTCQCPADKPFWNIDHCGPTLLCGNGVIDDGENCINCPDDAGCLNGTRCCQDGTCKSDCLGRCDNNLICDANETYFETCDCLDCLNWQDKCLKGLVCKENMECGCNLLPDRICPNDPYCKTVDPDCLSCNHNGVCELGENQHNCPDDCKTVVKVSPIRMYPGDRVNVTVYFNDSRYVMGQDAKLTLYLDDMVWINCSIHDSKWRAMDWNGNNNWKGKYMESEIEINSIDNYAEIKFDCTVPTILNQGMHTLKVYPSIFSKETKLNNGNAEFFVENKPVQFLKIIFLAVKLIF